MVTTEAYFDGIKEQIIKELDSSSHSVFVAVAWFTEFSLFEKLTELLKKGIDVKLIVADDTINRNCGINFTEIPQNGGFFKYIDGELLHHKFCVIDNRTVITGSFNWTNKAVHQNHENITITSGDFDLAFRFIEQFQKITGTIPNTELNTDINKLLKRLNIIRELIGLGDEEDIEYQNKRFRAENLDAELETIASAISKKKYDTAVFLINNYIKNKSSVSVFTDPRIAALQLEIKNLGFRIVSIDDELAEKHREIYFFNTQYYQTLGEIISKILFLKEEYFRRARQRNKYFEEDYQGTKQDRHRFESDKKELEEKPSKNLSPDDQNKLKKLYREGVVLCHPDKVAENEKEQANEKFRALQVAYEKQDLEKIAHIVSLIKAGAWEQSETLSDIDLLMLKKEQLEEKLNTKLHELEKLSHSKLYQEVQQADNLENYLQHKKEKLEKELNKWKEQVSEQNLVAE